MRLIVGDENTDWFLLIWNGSPPGQHRLSLR
jgi:hypothetical protein